MAAVTAALGAVGAIGGLMEGRKQRKAQKRALSKNEENIQAALEEWAQYRPAAMQAIETGAAGARGLWGQEAQDLQAQTEPAPS